MNNKFTFTFDLANLKNRKYSANYFCKTTRLLEHTKIGSETATMQFICFNDESIMVAGMAEVVALLSEVLPDWSNLTVEGVSDGAIITRNTPILKITGPYHQFAFLENVIDGILARRSSVATNCWRVLNTLAPNQKLIYMNDRNDDYITQPGDGYAAYIAGIRTFVTDMQVAWINDPNVKVMGTIPHALIQQYHNNITQMVTDYVAFFGEKPTVLIDFENDVIKTLTDLLPVFDKINAVRIDTSKHNVDQSLTTQQLHGVNPVLVQIVRDWLDSHNLQQIKIVVSSGITLNQIKAWEGVPIDIYGIGSYFLTKTVAISADLVKYNDEDFAKVGRHNLPLPAEGWQKYEKNKAEK